MNITDQTVSFINKYDDVVLSYLIQFGLAILILIGGYFFAAFVSKHLRKILTNRGVETTIVKFSSSTIRYIILAFTLVAVLGQLGVQTASIVAIIGAAGLAVGLALQGSLSNFAAGVLLILFRPFKVGELVTINSLQGTVDAIQIFSTTILTPTGEFVTIPNNQVLSANIINFARHPNRRIDLIIGVDYAADIKQTYQALDAAIKKTSRVLDEPASVVRLTELASSSINFIVSAWTINADYTSIRTELLGNIKMTLDEHKINIPFPVMDINIKNS